MSLLKRTTIMLWTGLFLANALCAAPNANTDKGYIFAGPREVKKTKQIKKGVHIVAYHQNGVFVSEQSNSPWFQAALFIQGTRIEDAKGKVLQDVALCEATDPDGDLNWSIFWRPHGDTGTVSFKLGTGKWEGILGKGHLPGIVRKRADNHVMPQYKIQWHIDPNDRHILNRTDQYKYHDRGLSFHGPHIEDFSRKLENGTSLKNNSQSGVLLSENPEAKAPRNFATCYDRGTTINTATGNGDIMLLEDTDPDGDVVWLCHIWWYGKGPGTYEFLGGIGKWKGITGVGVTQGMLRGRTDDHFMLKSEMHWNLPQ
ncbi:hypothetical protein ACFL6U_05405 [Planctomycetota bacterium]